jgi:hypothetical protein
MIYLTENDAGRVVVFDLKIDGVGEDLSSAAIVCHMQNRHDGTAITSAAVTADADQATNPGRVSTEFSATELATAGTFTLEWQATIGAQIVTYPGNSADRPIITIRSEVA